MNNHNNLLDLALSYNNALPQRIRDYLNGRGIPDSLIDSHMLGWNGLRITIPIYNRQGQVVHFKLAKDPQDKTDSPKMFGSPGAQVELYGWDRVIAQTSPIVICEGELDRLVLEAHGFAAVTSTAGAGTFRATWAVEFERIKNVYICFDRDAAGQRGAVRVGFMIPHARMVELPEEVGVGGDVTDYFVRLKRTPAEFLALLLEARPIPPELRVQNLPSVPATAGNGSHVSDRIERIKRDNTIVPVVARYVKLRPSGSNLVGICPFHEDRVPSLAVYPRTGRFHCFGCQKHGDVIDFVQEIEQLSFGEALDALDQTQSDYEFEPD